MHVNNTSHPSTKKQKYPPKYKKKLAAKGKVEVDLASYSRTARQWSCMKASAKRLKQKNVVCEGKADEILLKYHEDTMRFPTYPERAGGI